ncbi:MAG: protein-L-isoaspartate(D-aspartate) O-methyltransferase [Thermodesulfobacteriota bacterium]
MNELSQSEYRLARHQMVERQIKARGIKDPRLLEVMARIPRHLFVEEALAGRAYGDHPLPIGEQQTISQPYIVAQMTEALELTPTDRVLEIGTGSGYQTAILAELCTRVYTMERLKPLMVKAKDLLDRLGCRNVVYRVNDGTCGWPEQSPFEAVIVTAGAPEVPAPLLEQLAVGGRLVIPVGKTRLAQSLLKVVKDASGRTGSFNLGGCRFVDLVGRHGWTEEDYS